ncbi:hypothetical protein [Absidia glauca]|uniref:Uncharacterized protein n=1 Tax=Absidia glauca TaxID=4829 RepID=A0A168NJ52_ABSGL|nr:hypothetical protein [Absidia glauca]
MEFGFTVMVTLPTKNAPFLEMFVYIKFGLVADQTVDHVPFSQRTSRRPVTTIDELACLIRKAHMEIRLLRELLAGLLILPCSNIILYSRINIPVMSAGRKRSSHKAHATYNLLSVWPKNLADGEIALIGSCDPGDNVPHEDEDEDDDQRPPSPPMNPVLGTRASKCLRLDSAGSHNNREGSSVLVSTYRLDYHTLDKYVGGPGFSRNFRRNLRHCGSFLGRDFKALIQVIPIILMSVHGNLEDYIGLVRLAVEELTTALDSYDAAYPDARTNFAVKPKLHILHHLPDNIARFSPPLHYETGKGEQFNKFIRERIVNTNRHSVSRDIAKAFVKKVILRHIAESGSWTNDDGERTRRSDEVASFINEERTDLFPFLFGGSRDYQDNNDTSLALVYGRCGVFKVKQNEDPGPSTNRYIIGKAGRTGTGFDIMEYFSMGKDPDGNPLVRSTDVWHSQNDLVLEGTVDMDDRTTHCVVNQYKFGSYWMLNTLFD